MLMGTPYERGNSDIVLSRYSDVVIEEGLCVSYAASTGEDRAVVLFDGSNMPCGFSGMQTGKALAVVHAGLRVWVQVDALTSAVTGAQVGIDDTGKATAIATSGALAVNAVFTGRTASDGIVGNTATTRKNQICAEIDFAGGL